MNQESLQTNSKEELKSNEIKSLQAQQQMMNHKLWVRFLRRMVIQREKQAFFFSLSFMVCRLQQNKEAKL